MYVYIIMLVVTIFVNIRSTVCRICAYKLVCVNLIYIIIGCQLFVQDCYKHFMACNPLELLILCMRERMRKKPCLIHLCGNKLR